MTFTTDSEYPGGFDDFPAHGALQSDEPTHDDFHVLTENSVEAIQSTLGLNPQGSQASVSARFDTLEADSGFQPVTLNSTFSGSFNYRKIGRTVWMYINCTYNGSGISNTSVLFGTLPADARPSAQFGCVGVTSGDVAHRVTVGTGGGVTAPSLTIATSQVFSVTACWLV